MNLYKYLPALFILLFFYSPLLLGNAFDKEEIEKWQPELNYTIPEQEVLLVAQRLGKTEISTDVHLDFDLFVPADHASFLMRNKETLAFKIDEYEMKRLDFTLKKNYNIDGSKYYRFHFSGYLEYGQPIPYDFHFVTLFNEQSEVMSIPFYEEVEPDFDAFVEKLHFAQ